MKSFFYALFGAIFGGVIVYALIQVASDPFLEYYRVENAVAVSPHDLRLEMDKGSTDTIIVDLRSSGEYEREHIRGAINIPGIAQDASKEAQEQRIIEAFRSLPKDKRIVVHCYTHYCMLAKHVGLMLAKEGIKVHELNIGWNEWRNEWDLWNGKGTATGIDMSKYLEGTAVSPASQSGSGSGLDIAPCTPDGLSGC